jgi:hypothetical protein
MKFKIVFLGVLLTGLFLLGGCNCSCNSNDPMTTCPMPEKTASADL